MKRKILKLWQSSNIWTAVLCVFALLLIAAPMTYISKYIWPCSDDFELSLWTKEAFVSTGSVLYVLKRAWDFVVYKYFGWQGAYSSILLMALQPGIWGDEHYWIGVVLIMLSLLAGIFGLGYVLIVKYGKAPKSVWLTVTALPAFAWFLRVMYTEEAFYWWTGASYYTGFYAWGLMIVTALFCFYLGWERYGKPKKVLAYILSIFACLFVGGGNFPTTLMLLLIAGGLTAAAYFGRKPAAGILTCNTIAVLAALLISVLAPGNSNHMNNDFQADISAVQAIWISIRDGLKYIRDWTNISVIMLFVFLLPFIWQIVRSCGCKFRLPVLATILSGGLYLSEYAPVSYAFGGYAPGRMINLYYINFFWLLLFNVFYWLGWIDRRLSRKNQDGLMRMEQTRKKWQPYYVCAAGVLFLAATAKIGITNTNLYWVYSELYHGYYAEVDDFLAERVAYFEAHQGEDVTVEGIPYQSVITYFGDLFPETEHLVNQTMAEYYGVNSITLKESD